MSEKIKIAFMGTPDFALPSLRRLSEIYDVCAVFCQPDKPCGRGKKIIAGPVKEFALQNGIRVCQPDSFKDYCCGDLLKSIDPELIVVAAYGKILPEYVLNYPKYGCINVHGSLLPKYRGASPIQSAILNGDKRTGVTIMKMAKGLDTGDIISQVSTDIGMYETAGELFDRLSVLGADCLENTIRDIVSGRASYTPQNENESSYASMITKQMGLIDFNNDAEKIKCQVCALNPWPLAFINSETDIIKVYTVVIGSDTDASPGTIISITRKGIEIACGNKKSIILTQVQKTGKRQMDAFSFSLGAKLKTVMKINL